MNGVKKVPQRFLDHLSEDLRELWLMYMYMYVYMWL